MLYKYQLLFLYKKLTTFDMKKKQPQNSAHIENIMKLLFCSKKKSVEKPFLFHDLVASVC